MNGLNDLAAEVRFRERRRGYDYDEVDEYVKAVNRVVGQAREQIAELQKRLAQAEAGADDGTDEIRETLLRTLVLAQRTADSAVADARSESKSIIDAAKERAAKTVAEAEEAANERLRSAEERAAAMLAEGEENCQLIIAEAKRTAAAELALERTRAKQEIEALEATRAELSEAVDDIRTRLGKERKQLRNLSVSFQSFVEKFEPVARAAEVAPSTGPTEATEATLWSAEAPEGAGSDVPADEPPAGQPDEASDAALAAVAGAATEAGAAIASNGAEATTQTPALAADPAPDAGAEAPASTGSDVTQHGSESLTETPAEAPALAGSVGGGEPAEQAAQSAPGASPEGAAGFLPDPGLSPEELRAPFGEPTVPELPVTEWTQPAHAEAARAGPAQPAHAESATLVSAPTGSLHLVDTQAMPVTAVGRSGDLFDIDAIEDDEYIEQLRQVVSADAPMSDSDADAAMAAFFGPDPRTRGSRAAEGRDGRLGRRA